MQKTKNRSDRYSYSSSRCGFDWPLNSSSFCLLLAKLLNEGGGATATLLTVGTAVGESRKDAALGVAKVPESVF